MSATSRSKSMAQKLIDAEETITSLKRQLYGLPGKIMELESENFINVIHNIERKGKRLDK